MSDRDAVRRFAEHVAGTGCADIPEPVAAAIRTFLLATLGVGVAGSAGPWTRRLIETQRRSCPGDQARVWSHGTRVCEMQTMIHNDAGTVLSLHRNYVDAIKSTVKGLPRVPLGAVGGCEWPEFVWLDT